MVTHVQTALIRRREEIAREIRKLTKSLSHLDASIKLMAPDYKLPSARTGALTRQILQILREAKEPMTTQQIAEMIESEQEPVKDALKGQRQRGIVRGTLKSGESMVWEIKRAE